MSTRKRHQSFSSMYFILLCWLLLLVVVKVTNAWNGSFLVPSRHSLATTNRRAHATADRRVAIHMDAGEGVGAGALEQDIRRFLTFSSLQNPLRNKAKGTFTPQERQVLEDQRIDEAHRVVGMPWQSSVCERTADDALLYMPFWQWQIEYMKQNLTGLKLHPTTCRHGVRDYTYNDNVNDPTKKKKARVVNLNLSSNEFRKIRMTYFDGGNQIQVFNSLWYPEPSLEEMHPVLGIDLLSFNGHKKHLAVVDFQPIHERAATGSSDGAFAASHRSYEREVMKPIRDQYRILQGKMSNRFYDENQFFSKQMLFARFEDKSIVTEDLMPAFQQYVKAHVGMVKQNKATRRHHPKHILERQAAYDTYSAVRDPATKLFAANFGEEWADGFVYDFLFSMSDKDTITC